LPETFEYRETVLELLYTLQRYLANKPASPEDRELVMRLAPLYRQERDRAVQEGVQQGIQQGIQQEKEAMALNLLRDGFEVDRVVSLTQLPLDRVLELQQQLENENREG